jgi:hypothetical protein
MKSSVSTASCSIAAFWLGVRRMGVRSGRRWGVGFEGGVDGANVWVVEVVRVLDSGEMKDGALEEWLVRRGCGEDVEEMMLAGGASERPLVACCGSLLAVGRRFCACSSVEIGFVEWSRQKDS